MWEGIADANKYDNCFLVLMVGNNAFLCLLKDEITIIRTIIILQMMYLIRTSELCYNCLINNRKENIKVVAYSDNSIAISHLSSEGKQHCYTSVIPYSIDIETVRSTYRNGILEITFNRK